MDNRSTQQNQDPKVTIRSSIDSPSALSEQWEKAGQRTPLEEFSPMFTTFRSSAFRLETLPEYAVFHEDVRYGAYRRGDKAPPILAQGWKNTIRAATSEGKRFEIVRLVPDPMTEYLRFEIDWGYCEYRKDGQNTRLVLPGQLPPALRDQVGQDFWLFDDSFAVIMKYDLKGDILGFFRIDDVTLLNRLREIRDIAISSSLSLDEFLSKHYQSDRQAS